MTNHGFCASKEKEYYSSGEIAKMFGVTARTVATWCEKGKLPHIVTPYGHRRIPMTAIVAIARSNAAAHEHS